MRADLRKRIHAAVDTLLDLFDEYRSEPAEEELVRLREVALEERAKAELVREGRLRTVKIGREVWTRRSWVLAAVEGLAAAPPEPEDDLAKAARKRALKVA